MYYTPSLPVFTCLGLVCCLTFVLIWTRYVSSPWGPSHRYKTGWPRVRTALAHAYRQRILTCAAHPPGVASSRPRSSRACARKRKQASYSCRSVIALGAVPNFCWSLPRRGLLMQSEPSTYYSVPVTSPNGNSRDPFGTNDALTKVDADGSCRALPGYSR